MVLLTVNYPVTLIDSSARMVDPTAICVVRVRWEGLGFRPVVGSQLTGRIVLETASNVSLLLFNTFSATIDRSHIGSADDWRFDRKRKPDYPGVSDVDGAGEDFFAADDDAAAEGEEPREEKAFDAQPTGCWVNRHDGETLGGFSGRLTFTVTRSDSYERCMADALSLTVSGLAVTAHGSLLDDPFDHPDEGFQRRASSMLLLDSEDEGAGPVPPAPVASSPPPPEPAPAAPLRQKKRKTAPTTPQVAPAAEPVPPTEPTARKKKRRRDDPPPVAATAPALDVADAPPVRPPKKKRAKPNGATVPVPEGGA